MLTLDQLEPAVAYNVMRDSQKSESVIATGDRLRRTWSQAREYQHYRAEESMPFGHGGYVRVQCCDNVYLAVWRDPTRPELAEALDSVVPAHDAVVDTVVPPVESIADVVAQSSESVARQLSKVTKTEIVED